MIVELTWGEIFKIWREELWPNRSDPIEANSAMVFNKPGQYDIKNMHTPALFFGIKNDNSIIAVLSGHMCADNSYRIRGFWTAPSYRNQGFGSKLIAHHINQAKTEQAEFVWAFPRLSSVRLFEKQNFVMVSRTQDNFYVKLGFRL